MAFTAAKTMAATLLEITLPTGAVRLCDGGFIYKDGQKFESWDENFGTVETLEPITEGTGDEAPAGTIVFLPPSTAAAAALSQPTFQSSPIRCWFAEVDEATGTVVGTPELLFDWQLDTTELKASRGKRRLEVGFISSAERLFLTNRGNVLSPQHHKSIWPGEQGLDNATGLQIAVAWGVASPPRGSVSGTSGGGTLFGGALSGQLLERMASA